ncbi:MAG: phosphoserine phosphatase SerB [Pseudomonadota bacterium]
MMHLCTLIADPSSHVLDQALVDQVANTLRGEVDSETSIETLSEGAAYAVALSPTDRATLERVARATAAVVGERPIDLVIQPSENRRKRLFLADMDSTMIEQECIDELADELGLKPKIAEITARAMRGELAFEPALKERVAMLRGLSEAVIERVYRDRITFTPGGRELLATMRAHGTTCVLVSGGFTQFTSKVAAELGFNADHANTLIAENGTLTGDVGEPIQGREAKLSHLESYAAKLGLKLDDTMAIGDGANDLAMIKAAGLGVAFHAKPAVNDEAQAAIRYGNLKAALYLQGYRDDDIVSA